MFKNYNVGDVMEGKCLSYSRTPKWLAISLLGTSCLLMVGAASAEMPDSKVNTHITPTPEMITTYARPAVVPQGEGNPSTEQRVALGKNLFFDPRLSGSNFISCSTCHNPALGWSDGQPTAIGHNMQVLGRATPTIINTAYQRSQFWDGRAATLEEQALGPIVADVEMNQPIDELIVELSEVLGYVEMFEAAYPGEGITASTISKAIAVFERTVIAGESDFDRWLNGDKNAMSAEAQWGFAVFEGKGNCSGCHGGHSFTDDKFHNIGLKGVDNPGRYAIDSNESHKQAFKTPTLRDIARTAPYMHNGAYRTLAEVVEHYDRGGFDNGVPLSEDLKPSLDLSERDKKALVAFMEAVTSDPVAISIPQLPVK